MKTQILAGFVALAATLSGADAFVRMSCAGPLLVERADPIVNPGGVAGHMHNIVGGNGFKFSMGYKDALSATCSTCKAKKDKSNYWIPHLYAKMKNGTFYSVGNSGATIYYLQRNDPPTQEILPFPEGFRMLAGDPLRRTYQEGNVEQKAISFVCLGGTTGQTPLIPNAKCPSGLRVQIVMPSCGDGRLDSPDHKSHMAYPSGTDNGTCPPTHPKRYITLFYEFIYDISRFDSEWVNGKHPFMLSNGDPTGCGLHADFVNGWDVPTLARVIKECTALSGRIEDCDVLKNDVYEDSQMGDCMVPPSINEDVEGPMTKLPGCNPIQYGPGNAVVMTSCGPDPVIGLPETYSTDVSSKGWQYVGCAFDDLNSRTFPYRYASANMTVPMCIDQCTTMGYTFAGLEYGEECWCGKTIDQKRLGAMRCTIECAGNSKQYCGGPIKMSVYKKSVTPRLRRRYALPTI